MSRVVEGFAVSTRPGKYLRTYRIRGEKAVFLQETPDLHCATVFRSVESDAALLARAHLAYPKATTLNVRVVRVVEVV